MSSKKPTLFLPVCIEGGAVMFIQRPDRDATICYALIHSETVEKKVALQASAVIESFDYLLSSAVTMKEATRRLRLLREARRQHLKDHP
jgi:hypothetical protein